MVVEAAPSTAFEMSKSDFLLELLIVALDAPAQFGEVNQISKGNVLRKGRKPVFGRLVFSFWPLDQQPFLRSQLGAPFVAMRGANPQACKARAQRFGCAIAPCNRGAKEILGRPALGRSPVKRPPRGGLSVCCSA